MRFFGWLVKVERESANLPPSIPGAQAGCSTSPEPAPKQPPARVDAVPSRLEGDGVFELAAVGESHYQEALEMAAGEIDARGSNTVVEALLVPEDSNPYDSLAVRIDVAGQTVGYLSREEARRFRSDFATLIRNGRPVACQGRIRGGYDRGGGQRASLGIWLDIRAGDEELDEASPRATVGVFEFLASLMITTPLVALEHHGDRFEGRSDQAPRYGSAGDGIWIQAYHSFSPSGSHRPESSHAADVGPIRPSEYLPFLKAFRTIAESGAPVDEKITLMLALGRESPGHVRSSGVRGRRRGHMVGFRPRVGAEPVGRPALASARG